MIAATSVALLTAVVLRGALHPPVHRALPRARAAPRAEREGALIALLDTAAREVRSGSSLAAALRAAQRTHPDAPPLAATTTDPDVALAAQAVNVASALGGAPAAALDNAAAVLRERRALRAERAVHSAQARLSARVLTAVPLCFAAWVAASSETTMQAYTSTPAGALAVGAGLALNATGWWWMRRIVR